MYEVSLPLYQITFFLAFIQAKLLTSLFTYALWQKNLLTIFHTVKTFQNKKEYVLIKCILNTFLLHILCCKDMIKPYYIKGVQGVKKTPSVGRSCSWKFCKIHRKATVFESLFNKVVGVKRVHHNCFPMKCFV